MRIIRHSWIWAALAVLAFATAFSVRVWTNSEGQALTLPGTVLQSSSASANDVAIDVQRGVFSATAVDIDLFVRSEDPDLAVVGVMPADSRLAGEAGVSAWMRQDGRVSLRFPPEAWPEAGDTADLQIQAVQVQGESGLERLPVFLRFDVRLPRGDEAKTARKLRALQPASVEVDGQEMQVQAFRTHSAVVVRYSLPQGVFSSVPPTLKADGAVLDLNQAWESEGVTEIWYRATEEQHSFLLVMDALREGVAS